MTDSCLIFSLVLAAWFLVAVVRAFSDEGFDGPA